jgi:hypothetical protein
MVNPEDSLSKVLLHIKIWRSLKAFYGPFLGGLFLSGFIFLLIFSSMHSAGRAFFGSGDARAILVLSSTGGLFFALLAVIKGFFMTARRFTRTLEKEHPELGTSLTGAHELQRGRLNGASRLFAGQYVEQARVRVSAVASPSFLTILGLLQNLFFLAPLILSVLVFSRMYPASFQDTLELLMERTAARDRKSVV